MGGSVTSAPAPPAVAGRDREGVVEEYPWFDALRGIAALGVFTFRSIVVLR